MGHVSYLIEVGDSEETEAHDSRFGGKVPGEAL